MADLAEAPARDSPCEVDHPERAGVRLPAAEESVMEPTSLPDACPFIAELALADHAMSLERVRLHRNGEP